MGIQQCYSTFWAQKMIKSYIIMHALSTIKSRVHNVYQLEKPVNTHHFLIYTPSCHHIFITKNNHKKTPTKVSSPYHAYSQHCSNILFPQENDFISHTTDQMTIYCQLMQYTCLFVILKSWLKKKMTCIQLYFNKEKGETNAFLNDRDQFFHFLDNQ